MLNLEGTISLKYKWTFLEHCQRAKVLNHLTGKKVYGNHDIGFASYRLKCVGNLNVKYT